MMDTPKPVYRCPFCCAIPPAPHTAGCPQIIKTPDQFDFGDVVQIEQRRFGAPNEMFLHKVIGRAKSNTWIDVPAQTHLGAVQHDSMEDILYVVCIGPGEGKIERYRAIDCVITAPSNERGTLRATLHHIQQEVVLLRLRNGQLEAALNAAGRGMPASQLVEAVPERWRERLNEMRKTAEVYGIYSQHVARIVIDDVANALYGLEEDAKADAPCPRGCTGPEQGGSGCAAVSGDCAMKAKVSASDMIKLIYEADKASAPANGWDTFKNPPAATVNSRDVGGVLCRWWGDGPEPAGVALIDAAVQAGVPYDEPDLDGRLLQKVLDAYAARFPIPPGYAANDVVGEVVGLIESCAPGSVAGLHK